MIYRGEKSKQPTAASPVLSEKSTHLMDDDVARIGGAHFIHSAHAAGTLER